jgi:cyclophilin family peptidyl-prolyl cis-trans isomerase
VKSPSAGAVLLLALAVAACAAPSPSITPSACPTSAPTADAATAILADATRAVVKTSLGSFTIELDARTAPIATANFVALARCGFYEQISFHRVLAGFVAQAGDPQTKANHGSFDGLGSGGPGYAFEVEFPDQRQPYDKYVVAMANAMQYDAVTGQITGGTDTNGSQFFIDLDSLAGRLRPYDSVIGAVPVTNRSEGVPTEPVIIESVTIQSGA